MNAREVILETLEDQIGCIEAGHVTKEVLAALAAANIELCPGWEPIDQHPKDQTIRPMLRPGNPAGWFQLGVGSWSKANNLWNWNDSWLDKPYHDLPTHFREPLSQPRHIAPPESME